MLIEAEREVSAEHKRTQAVCAKRLNVERLKDDILHIVVATDVK